MNTLQRGQKYKLPLSGCKVRIEIEASAREGQVLDMSCFGLDANGQLSDDRYFIFYNQKASSCGAVSMLEGAAFDLDLSRLPAHVRRLMFAVTVEGAGCMADLNSCQLKVTEADETIAQFEFSGEDFSVEKALMIAELYWKDGWRLSAVGQGFSGGLGALLRHFGGEEAHEESVLSEDLPAHVLQIEPQSTPASAPSTTGSSARRGRSLEKSEPSTIGAVPTRLTERLVSGLKKYQPILVSARTRDVNEADTVRIISDMLAEIWGYDKYSEVTSEHGIKGTYCDIAIQIGGAVKLLLEAKAVGIDLKENHVKQAVDYAANKGCDWVVLTNGVIWRVYKVAFTKPIEHELVLQLDMLALNVRNQSHIESLFLLSRESLSGPGLATFHAQKQATNKFSLAAILLSEPMLELLRREVRRLSPEVRVPIAELREALMNEVLKREIVEGDKAVAARKQVKKAATRALRAPRDESQSL
jgi:stress response protein SCP2